MAEERSDVPGIPGQGFRLIIEPTVIHLEAADARGLFYGRQTLAEILKAHQDEPIPCCRIEDWPDFPTRGYMLDVSRDRVPTMAHLFRLVDCLAKLRYNQLQLYTEHTFAYAAHEIVWSGSSPITAEEIRELDRYCRERHIELVANQNSFGHMERWLEHDAYKHLAECPEGFRHPISGEWRPQGSVLKPDRQSLDFLNGLYAELLPNFSSTKFNIGGDEPWELGWGATEARVTVEGKHRVYADFLARICELAVSHGAEPMCWADVLLEEPSTIEQLPESIQAILWGYETEHPFEEQCAQLAALGRSFYVAPGDSTWSSYTGRYSTMVSNVRTAAQVGHCHGASGLLMTHWGDGGHPQTWPVSLPGLVWAGLCSWNSETDEKQLACTLSSVLQDKDGIYTQTLVDAGRIDQILDCRVVNASYLAKIGQLDDSKLAAFQPRPAETSIREAMQHCGQGLKDLEGAKLARPDADDLIDELKLMLLLNFAAARRSLGEPECTSDDLIHLYQACWRKRSREGGLVDSLRKNRISLVGD